MPRLGMMYFFSLLVSNLLFLFIKPSDYFFLVFQLVPEETTIGRMVEQLAEKHYVMLIELE